MTSQLITPNPNIPCKPGWCLAYVNEAFGVGKRYGSATAAWNGSTTQHKDRNFPAGVWVPVWYGLDTTPLGHVVLLAPDGTVYSTSDLSNTPYHHPNLAHLEAFYAYYGMTLTYRGWTEDVEDTPVMSLSADGINYSGTITAQEETVALEESDRQTFKEFMDDYFLNTPRFDGRTIFQNAERTRQEIAGVAAGVTALPTAIMRDYRVDNRNAVDWFKHTLAVLYAQKPAGVEVDVKALAAALAEQLPKSDVAALAAQLQITVKEG